jgi:hypothetical protein
MTFEDLGKIKYDINHAYSEMFQKALEHFRGHKFSSLSEEILARQEYLKEYKETVYAPAKHKLQKDCAKLGHKLGDAQAHYHDNNLGWQWQSCCYCGVALRRWLDYEELKIENGAPVNNGSNWILLDGAIGPSCLYSEV